MIGSLNIGQFSNQFTVFGVSNQRVTDYIEIGFILKSDELLINNLTIFYLNQLLGFFLTYTLISDYNFAF